MYDLLRGTVTRRSPTAEMRICETALNRCATYTNLDQSMRDIGHLIIDPGQSMHDIGQSIPDPGQSIPDIGQSMFDIDWLIIHPLQPMRDIGQFISP